MSEKKKHDLDEYIHRVEVEYKIAMQQEELRSIRFKRQFKMLGVILAVYVVSAMLALFLVHPEYKLSKWFANNNTSVLATRTEVDNLRQDVNDLRSALESLDGKSDSNAILESRIDKIEATQDSIAASILESPDKALTAALLREKQQAVEVSLERLEQTSKDTSNKVDTFVSNLLTVPIVGFFITVLIAVITFFLSNIKTKKEKTSS